MKLSVNTDKIIGKIKPLNAVNNGPVYTENADQNLTNLPEFKEANIPYVRTHDSSICYDYGGEHTIDVINIFTDFDADPYSPDSYDFTLTDMYLDHIMLSGAQVFYRLGNKIEHWPKHYGIMPPKDFKKWAVICEHIIRHTNEGWANGHHRGIVYWEIWNEPDFNNKCWTGTPEEFFDLFEITAKHLKSCFPEIKIGGPAVCRYNADWLIPFFEEMKKRNVPMDFYSWHCYSSRVEDFIRDTRLHRALLDRYGYNESESILNEWNYVCGWSGEEWKKSLATELSVKGAAFIAAVATACQHERLDMLMYYDARINSTMNGLFRPGTLETRKGYYPLKIWGEMLSSDGECETLCDIPDIYAVSAVKDGASVTMITYYSDDDEALPRTFTVELSGDVLRTVYLLDGTHDMTACETIAPDNGCFSLTMKPNTVVVIR